MPKTPPTTTKHANKERKLDLVIRSLEKKVDPKRSSKAGGSCARVYCI
jgi:hypothetical protein